MSEYNPDFNFDKLAFDLEGTNEIGEYEYTKLDDGTISVCQFDDYGNAEKKYILSASIKQVWPVPMKRFRTPLGCIVTVLEAPDHLGEGVLLHYSMEDPDDGRESEVFLDKESMSKLIEVLGVSL